VIFASPLRHYAELGVALGRVVRFHGPHHALHALHDVGEIEVDLHGFEAEFAGTLRLRDEPRRLDQGLGGHAARVEAVPAHLAFLDQSHFRPDRGRDVGRHQTGGTRADHDEVAVESGRFRPSRQPPARLKGFDGALGNERKNAEQHERADQRRGENPRERFDGSQLGARVHVHDRGGKHADLAHPVERAGADRRESHEEIDQHERKRRDQPQRKQVERTLFRQAGVDCPQPVAEPAAHRFTEKKPGGEKGERCAYARG